MANFHECGYPKCSTCGENDRIKYVLPLNTCVFLPAIRENSTQYSARTPSSPEGRRSGGHGDDGVGSRLEH